MLGGVQVLAPAPRQGTSSPVCAWAAQATPEKKTMTATLSFRSNQALAVARPALVAAAFAAVLLAGPAFAQDEASPEALVEAMKAGGTVIVDFR